jgi:methionyl-tRNA formyltransferase
VLFAGNKERGTTCLRALLERGHPVCAVIAHAGADEPIRPGSVAELARQRGLPLFCPKDPNEPELIAELRSFRPELTVLAGYGPIVGPAFIELAPHCINLHGGRLPQVRGSSPMNWALLHGHREFGISIIAVAPGVDAGDVLAERLFPIGADDTIADLQEVANAAFPPLLLEVVDAIAANAIRPRRQDPAESAYYPLRFPEDGVVFWDQLTAKQVHDRVRALTDPYPGAFSFFGGRRVRLLRTQLTARPFYGEPGRIYRTTERGLLVCARDACLWLLRAVFEDDGSPVAGAARRYDKFATVQDLALTALSKSARP